MKLYILLIILSLFISIGCSKKQPISVQKKVEAKKQIEATKQDPVKIDSQESLSKSVKNPSLFPEYNVDQYQYLDQTQLYEKIDGAADGWVNNFGFIGCGYLELKHKVENVPIFIYLSDMEKSIQSFGVYKSEHPNPANVIQIGAEGNIDEKGLNFWNNKYYVKIELQGKVDPEKGKKLLLELGNKINGLIKADPDALKLFDPFPKEGMIENSKKYYKGNYIGESSIKNVTVVEYKTNDPYKPAALFISRLNDEKEASTALSNYIKKYLDIKSPQEIQLDQGAKGLNGKDALENKLVTAVVYKNMVISAVGFSDEATQKKMVNAVLNKLN